MKSESKPATHTAFKKKKMVIFGGVALVGFFALARLSSPTNIAQTSSDDADARLHPRVYDAPPSRVAQEIRALVPQLKTYGRTWKINAVKTRGDENVLRVDVPVLIFTDDLKVTLSPQNGGASTRVEVHSASRVGKGDFGENRRHIVQFLTALDARFS